MQRAAWRSARWRNRKRDVVKRPIESLGCGYLSFLRGKEILHPYPHRANTHTNTHERTHAIFPFLSTIPFILFILHFCCTVSLFLTFSLPPSLTLFLTLSACLSTSLSLSHSLYVTHTMSSSSGSRCLPWPFGAA